MRDYALPVSYIGGQKAYDALNLARTPYTVDEELVVTMCMLSRALSPEGTLSWKAVINCY